MLGIGVDLLVYTIIIPVMPFQLERLGYDRVSALTATIPVAMLSERYNNRKIPLIIGLLLLLGSQILLMEAPTYTVMCVARVMQGISSTVVWTIGLALLCDVTPPSLIGRQMGIAMAGLSIGSLIGPPAGGAIYSKFGYRGPFIFGIIWTVVDLIARLLIIERKEALKSGIDPQIRNPLPADTESSDAAGKQAVADEKQPHPGIDDKGELTMASGDVTEDKSRLEAPSAINQTIPPITLPRTVLRLAKSSRALVAFMMTFAYGQGYLHDSGAYSSTSFANHMGSKFRQSWTRVLCCSDTDPFIDSPGWMVLGQERTGIGDLYVPATRIALVAVSKVFSLTNRIQPFEAFFVSGVISPITAELAHVSHNIEGVGYAHIYGGFNLAYGVGSVVGPLMGGQIYDNVKRGWLAVCLRPVDQTIAKEDCMATMNNSAYPSPMSDTASTTQAIDNEALPALTQTSPQGLSETQMSFQQASVALEAAYRRIRQFRRSLLEVAEMSASRERQTRLEESAYPSPEQSLRGVTTSDNDGLLSSSPNFNGSSTGPSSPPSSNRRRYLPPLTTSVSPRDTIGGPQLARSQLESRFVRHRETSADDAFTTLGRRVAAREAAAASNSNSGPRPNTSAVLSHYDEPDYSQIITAIQREFDNFRDTLRQRQQSGSSTASPDGVIPPLSRRPLEARRQFRARGSDSDLPANGGPQSEWLRRRLPESVIPSRSTTTLSSQSRLSLLSNFSSVQNLPTPVSTNSSRPLLFEEPTSYTHSVGTPDDTWSTDHSQDPDRSYIVRRRYTPDGEEHVHPISLNWIDEPLTHARPSARAPSQHAHPEVAPRRRGWARLDPDGNEIPWEEEVEVERARSEHRLQARSDPDPPTTSTSLIPEDDDSTSNLVRIPRVRLNSPSSSNFLDIGIEPTNVEQKHISSQETFRSNPLPTPLEDMVWTQPRRKPLRANKVPKHASFAGR
ncbi:hypothetical protein H0H93_013068 [Arthromyces matolae]|nr:hypothetical protein H0H93_013068 [Arthromyces matolae]